MAEVWTIEKIMDFSAAYFKTHGIESPRLTTEILLAHLLSLKRIDLYLQFERQLTRVELAAYKELLQRVKNHEPVAHMTGKKEFYLRDFFVTSSVPIPRPETELLVAYIVTSLKTKPQPQTADSHTLPLPSTNSQHTPKKLRGLEIGLGSGCIAISLLCDIPDLHMDAIEVSLPAIDIAKKNATQHGVADRLNIVLASALNETSWQQFLPASPNMSYQFVVSNPPYIASHLIPTLEPTVKNLDPLLALDGGIEGLDFYLPIAKQAGKLLATNGFAIVEIGNEQGYAVTKIFAEHGWHNIRQLKDWPATTV